MSCTFGRDRQTCERATKIRHVGNLLSKLANDGSFLSEPQDGLSLYLERTRVHLLSVQGNESCIALIGLDRREHGFGEVLYLQRILHADSNSGDIEHIQQQGAVVPYITQWILPSLGRVPINCLIPAVVLLKVRISPPLSEE